MNTHTHTHTHTQKQKNYVIYGLNKKKCYAIQIIFKK